MKETTPTVMSPCLEGPYQKFDDFWKKILYCR